MDTYALACSWAMIKNDTQPDAGEWTVFDDFRLLYASRTIDEDLILDEDRSDLSYLTTCKNNYKKQGATP